MKVFSNSVPSDCEYLTNGKHYEFEPSSSGMGYGYIIDDDGQEIPIITEYSGSECAFLNDFASWGFVK